jgi:hypothetical protein
MQNALEIDDKSKKLQNNFNALILLVSTAAPESIIIQPF